MPMTSGRLQTVLAAVVLVAGVAGFVAPHADAAPRPAGDDRPAIFADLSLEEARAAAGEERLLIVYLTAVWCMPCQGMKRNTWSDEAVVDFLRERAVVVALDIDHDPDARRFTSRGVPTMIVERGGREIDRHLGALSSEQLIGWIDGVEQGRTFEAMEQDRVDAQLDSLREDPGALKVQERYGLAKQLLRLGRHDEALEHFLWLWINMLDLDPSMVGVRLSFMSSDMQTLAGLHLPARAAFRTLCDATQAKVEEGAADDSTVRDWFELCKIVGETERILAWYEGERAEDGGMPSLPALVRDQLVDLLLERNRALEAGRLVADPVAEARRQCSSLRMLKQYAESNEDDSVRQMMESMVDYTRTEVAELAALMLLAGRESEAGLVADVLLAELDDAGTRVALVEAAIDRDAPLVPRHLEWLDEVIAASEADAAARAGAGAKADAAAADEGRGALDRLLGLFHPDAVARARRLRPRVAERLEL